MCFGLLPLAEQCSCTVQLKGRLLGDSLVILGVLLSVRRGFGARRELGPESLKVPGLGLQLCGLQEWCWLVSTVLDLVEVERQLDLSSMAARLRGSLV
ncbi:hypothetical protein Taro_047322 [Colocasia esculenta]|uniref:Uncharacterized protein n=1 Tax=Colocasia esculenta TaxID=4460 RepID=A0A843X5B0_COLES|nr:hypothetical protein [Colocasia esculenta]